MDLYGDVVGASSHVFTNAIPNRFDGTKPEYPGEKALTPAPFEVASLEPVAQKIVR